MSTKLFSRLHGPIERLLLLEWDLRVSLSLLLVLVMGRALMVPKVLLVPYLLVFVFLS